ncbi:MAG: PDZ domain-containing protein [Pyrinomonadaceae bacterium]
MHIRLKFASFCLFVLFLTSVAAAQSGKLDITYTVALRDTASQQFQITTDIKNIKQDRLDLALPTWTPGWYVVENYGKNLIRFDVTDGSGKRLQPLMTRKQTWSVPTKGVNQIRVTYSYRAGLLGLNQAKVGDDYAFFTGIQLFMEPLGHRNDPSTLKFQIPQGWKLISPLKNTADPMTFTAADYDTLVDAPAMMGNFDIHEFSVDGKPHYFTAYPAGRFNAEKSKKFTEMLGASIHAQGQIFGGLPYEKYIAFYFFQPAESNASGALEHLNSFVAFAPGGERSTPEQIIGTASHEFFHLWNVKRIRPAEMWPYDYSRENESPSLWFSEGFTNYYGLLANYRAGNVTREEFLNSTAGAAAAIESTEARKFISPANSSVITWVGYDTPQAFSISYYTQGQNIGALLDLSIRHDTNAAAGLDDVLRALYNENYERGKGFTINELIAIINRITKKDYRGFFDKYVFGVEVPDYETIFGYAGFALGRTNRSTPEFGFSGRPRTGGLTLSDVEPESAASAAGLRVGDVITKIDGQPTLGSGMGSLAGKDVKLTVTRGNSEMEIPMKVGSRQVQFFTFTEMANATSEQVAVRNAWLKK